MISDDWLDLPELLDNTQELLDLGLIVEAKDLLDKYESVFRDYWEFHFLYSRVYTEQNQPREAVTHLLRGLRLERDSVDCMLGLFYAHAMMNRISRGGKFLLKAAELEPDNELILSALIWYYTEVSEPEKAIACFERAQRISSNNPETYRNAAVAFERLGRFEEAEACYKAALIIEPGFDEVRDMYADHLIFKGNVDEAVNIYEEALLESPKNIRHMSKLIYCFSQKGQFDAAEELANRSISWYPNSPLGYIDLAYVHLNTGNFDAATAAAETAISISPIDAEGYRVMAIAHSESNNFDTAEAFFEKAISLDPEHTDIMRDYYRHLRVAGKHEQMVELIEKVIKLEYPYCTEDYWFMADYYRESKQDVKAFRYLRLAHDSMPAEKELLPPMIEILLERGHTKYSLPIFANYVQKGGWTNAINILTMDKQFRSRRIQEGMRFLRFTGERSPEFRRYIFRHYLYRYGLMYYTIIMAALTFPASVMWGWLGAGGVAAAYAASLAVLKIIRIIKLKKLSAPQTNL